MMTHAEMDDLYELYVLRVLEPSLVLEIDDHLRANCDYCRSHIEDAQQTTTALAALATAHAAPGPVRARVLQAIDTPVQKPLDPPHTSLRLPSWLLVAAAGVALTALCVWQAFQIGARDHRLQEAEQASRVARAQTVRTQQRETEAARTEAARLTDQLRVAQTRASTLQGEVNAARLQLTAKDSALQSSSSETTNLRAQISGAAEQLSRTQSERAAALANATTLQNRLSASQTETSDIRAELASVRSQLAELTAERNTLQTAVQILNRPRTRTVAFGANEADPHGRVLLDQRGGIVFLASALPSVATGRALELWIVPKNGAPVPVGLLDRDTNGASSKVVARGVDASQIKALAVSDEPATGSTAPTTKPFLLVPLG